RKTKQVVNTETKFAFQKGKDIIYITMKKLTSLSDFMDQLEEMIKPYYEKTEALTNIPTNDEINEQTSLIIEQLEHEKLLSLIDRALDGKNGVYLQSLSMLLI